MRKKNTVLFIIIIVPLILVIPINILLIYYSRGSVEQSKQEIIDENNAWMQVYVHSIEEELQRIDNYAQILLEENSIYEKLSDETFTRDRAEFSAVQNQMIAELSKDVAVNNVMTSITLYFSPSDTYINRDSLGPENGRDVNDFLSFLGDEKTGDACDLGEGWKYLETDHDTYLAAIYHTKNSRCMITASLNEFLFDLEREDNAGNYDYFFCMQKDKLKAYDKPVSQLKTTIDTDAQKMVVDDREYYNNSVQIYGLDLYLTSLISDDDLNQRIPDMTKILLLFSLLTCFVGPIISVIFLIYVERPLKLLNEGMEEVRKGNTTYRIPVKDKWQNEFDELNTHFNQMLDDLEQTKLKLYEQQIDSQKIQIRYLNQQIRPHFILNALNIIYMYGNDEFPLAKQMVMYLIKYFRYLVNLNSDYARLSDEMAHVENYLSIQKLRYPDRFEYYVEWEEEVRNAKIPAVVIQTFVENSIKYGFEKGKFMFIIVMAKKVDPNKIYITVADTGKGFEQEKLRRVQQFIKTRRYDRELGAGIQNVVNRLALLYGEAFDISIDNAPDGGTRMGLEIPFVTDEDGEADQAPEKRKND